MIKMGLNERERENFCYFILFLVRNFFNKKNNKETDIETVHFLLHYKLSRQQEQTRERKIEYLNSKDYIIF